MNHTMWKRMKTCAPKWCQNLCAFLLEATCAFGKMWNPQFKNNQEKIAANLHLLASSCVHFSLRSLKPFERCGFLVSAKSSVNCCANYLSRQYQFRTCHQCSSASSESGTRLLWLQTWNLRSWSDMNFKLSMTSTLNQNFRGQFHCVRTRWQGVRSCARLGSCTRRHRSTLRNPPQVKVLKSYLYNFFIQYIVRGFQIKGSRPNFWPNSSIFWGHFADDTHFEEFGNATFLHS